MAETEERGWTSRVPKFGGPGGCLYHIFKEHAVEYLVSRNSSGVLNPDFLTQALTAMFITHSSAAKEWAMIKTLIRDRVARAVTEGDPYTPAEHYDLIWALLDDKFGKSSELDLKHFNTMALNQGPGAPPGGGETPRALADRAIQMWEMLEPVGLTLNSATSRYITAMLPPDIASSLDEAMKRMPREQSRAAVEAAGYVVGRMPNHYNIDTAGDIAQTMFGHAELKQAELDAAKATVQRHEAGARRTTPTTTPLTSLSQLTARQKTALMAQLARELPGYSLTQNQPQTRGAPQLGGALRQGAPPLTGSGPNDGCLRHPGGYHTNAACRMGGANAGPLALPPPSGTAAAAAQQGGGSRWEMHEACGRVHDPNAECWGRNHENSPNANRRQQQAGVNYGAVPPPMDGAAAAARIAELEAQLQASQLTPTADGSAAAAQQALATGAQPEPDLYAHFTFPTFMPEGGAAAYAAGTAGLASLAADSSTTSRSQNEAGFTAGTALAGAMRLPPGFPVTPVLPRAISGAEAGRLQPATKPATRSEATITMDVGLAVGSGLMKPDELPGVHNAAKFTISVRELQQRKRLHEALQEAEDVNALANADTAVVQHQQLLKEEQQLQAAAIAEAPGMKQVIDKLPPIPAAETEEEAHALAAREALRVSKWLDDYRRRKASLSYHPKRRPGVNGFMVRVLPGGAAKAPNVMNPQPGAGNGWHQPANSPERWYTPNDQLRDGGADVNIVSETEAIYAGLRWRDSGAKIQQSTGSLGGVLGEVIDSHLIEYVLGYGTPQETRYTLSPAHKLFVVKDNLLYGWLCGGAHDREVGGYVDHVGIPPDAQQGAYRWRSRLQLTGDVTVDGATPLITSQIPAQGGRPAQAVGATSRLYHVCTATSQTRHKAPLLQLPSHLAHRASIQYDIDEDTVACHCVGPANGCGACRMHMDLDDLKEPPNLLHPDSVPVQVNGAGCFCECGGCDIADGHTADTGVATEAYRACVATLAPDDATTETDDADAPSEQQRETPEQREAKVDTLVKELDALRADVDFTQPLSPEQHMDLDEKSDKLVAEGCTYACECRCGRCISAVDETTGPNSKATTTVATGRGTAAKPKDARYTVEGCKCDCSQCFLGSPLVKPDSPHRGDARRLNDTIVPKADDTGPHLASAPSASEGARGAWGTGLGRGRWGLRSGGVLGKRPSAGGEGRAAPPRPPWIPWSSVVHTARNLVGWGARGAGAIPEQTQDRAESEDAFSAYTHAVAVITIANTNRVVLINETKGRGLWLPGGERMEGETPWQAAQREILEETGLSVGIEHGHKVEWLRDFEDKEGRRLAACWAVEIQETPDMSKAPDEHSEGASVVRWLDFTRASRTQRPFVTRFNNIPDPIVDHMSKRHHELFGGPTSAAKQEGACDGETEEAGGATSTTRSQLPERAPRSAQRRRGRRRAQQPTSDREQGATATGVGGMSSIGKLLSVMMVIAMFASGGAAAGTWTPPGALDMATMHVPAAALLAGSTEASVTNLHATPDLPTSTRRWTSPAELARSASPHGPEPLDDPMAAPLEKDPGTGVLLGHHPEMTEEQRQRVRDLIKELIPCFAFSMADCTGYTGEQGNFRIELNTDDPIFSPPRRLSPAEQEVQDEKCNDLLANGIIEKVDSSKYAMATTYPRKKDVHGVYSDKRFCLDARRLNDATIPDSYRTPRADQLFQDYGKGKYKSKGDCRSGFMQILMHEEDKLKTSFWWRGNLYCMTRMGFGFKNASQKFQRCVDGVRAKYGISECCAAFIDDILITSDTFDQHVTDVKRVFNAFRMEGLMMHPEKTVLFADSIEYLGHNISHNGLTPHEAKISAIKELRPPQDVSECRAQLGFFAYYSGYVPGYSEVVRPMTKLTSKAVSWTWGEEQQRAHDSVKALLCKPGLVIKRLDYSKPIRLYTDWSKDGLSAVLGQPDGDKECMVACISRSCNKHEAKYASYQGEMLAAVWGMRSLRHMLDGVHFTVVTDHQPLCWLMSNDNLHGHYARWALSVQDLDFTIEHRAGKKHQNADVTSRFPRADMRDTTGARMDHDEQKVPPHPAGDAALRDVSGDPRVIFEPGATTTAVSLTSAATARYHAMVTRALQAQGNTWIDNFAPKSEDLLEEAAGSDTLAGDHAQPADAEVAENDRADAAVRQRKATAEMNTRMQRERVRPSRAEHPAELRGRPDRWGVRETVRLDTRDVGRTFLSRAHQEGITLCEPFGGLCAGLEMVLRAGLLVHRYVYVDIDPAAHKVAQHRLELLHQRYPRSFPRSASAHAFTTLPQDVRTIGAEQLVNAGLHNVAHPLLLVAGWECQDLSQAGNGAGLHGKHSRTYFDILRITGALQQLRAAPTGYVLENSPMQYHQKRHIREGVYPHVCHAMGEPLDLDAARFNSGAHRHRNFWTNLGDTALLAEARNSWHRDPTRTVDGLLEPGRFSAPATHREPAQFYPSHAAATSGQPMARRTMPTLVSYSQSRGFVLGAAGRLHDGRGHDAGEPNPNERERMLGYTTGDTAAAGVTQLQRHEITGRCMDANAMRGLWHCIEMAQAVQTGVKPALAKSPADVTARALPPEVLDSLPAHQLRDMYGEKAWALMTRQGWQHDHGLGKSPGIHTPLQPRSQTGKGGLGHSPDGVAAVASHLDARQLFDAAPLLRASSALAPEPCVHAGVHAALAAHVAHTTPEHQAARVGEMDDAVETAVHGRAGHADIWRDEPVMQMLRTNAKPPGAPAREVDRIVKRARSYSWQGGTLYRRLLDNTTRACPPPERRPALVRQQHEQAGHYGARRTAQLLSTSFWWHGMAQDAANHVRQCHVCARTKATFGGETQSNTLQTLPVGGLHYRWSLDLGELAVSHRGSKYIMLAVEHFSGYIVAVPLADKSAETVAFAFETSVLAHFGAPAEVLTDQGTEFYGAFDEMLERWLIDHRRSAPEHPQSDGKSERGVKTIKTACKAMALDAQDPKRWDDFLPTLMIAYNASAQQATRISPYHLMYAAAPVIPPGARARLSEPMDAAWVLRFPTDDGEVAAAAAELHARASAVAASGMMAAQNLLITQHRDRKRYKDVRSGKYVPRQRRFEVGDFVFVKYSDAQMDTMRPTARAVILRVHKVTDAGALELIGSDGTTKTVPAAYCARCPLPNVDGRVRQDAPITADTACRVCSRTDQEEVMVLCDGCDGAWHVHCLTPAITAVPSGDWFCARCSAMGRSAEAPRPSASRRAVQAATTDAGQRFHTDAQGLDGQQALVDGAMGVVEYMGLAHRPRCFRVRFADGTTTTLALTALRRALKAAAPSAAPRPAPQATPTPAPASSATPSPTPPVAPPQIPRRYRPCAQCRQRKYGVERCRAAGHAPELAAAPDLPADAAGDGAAATSAAVHTARDGRLDLLPDTLEHIAHAFSRWWPFRDEFQEHMLCDAWAEHRRMSARHLYPPGEVSEAELAALMRHLRWRALAPVVDPGGDVNRIRPYLARYCDITPVYRIMTAPRGRGDISGDPASPRTYTGLTIGAIIGVPWPQLTHWFLPLWAVAVAAPVTCALVAGDYLSTAPQACLAWLHALSSAGRLAILGGLPWSLRGDRRQWIIITDSGARMHHVLAHAPTAGTSFIWAGAPEGGYTA